MGVSLQLLSSAYRAGWFAIIIFAAIATTSGCAVRLAPPYDAGIEQETAALHKSIETFFQAMKSGGAAERSYNRNEDFYVQSLASMQSLKVRATARWSGDSSVLQAFGARQSPEALTIKSTNDEAEMFARLIQITENIRTAHEQFGMKDANIPIYQDQFRLAFTAILQYESFLKRQ